MESAKNAERSLSELGKRGGLAILQYLKDAGKYVEFKELAKSGGYGTAQLAHRLREHESSGLVKKDIRQKEGIFYTVSQKGILVLESALEMHELFSEP